MNFPARLFVASTLLLIALFPSSQAQLRKIKGTYKNYAQGFALTIPPGLEGATGDQAGPERGVGITTPSGAVIGVSGEPNSLEWKTPEEGVKWSLDNGQCSSSKTAHKIAPARIGPLLGAEGRLQCGNRVYWYIVAFRPKGGPIYTLSMSTTTEHEANNLPILRDVAAHFKLIVWR